MEPADITDLERASRQGTILQIKVNGTMYGSGGYESFYVGPQVVAERVVGGLAIVIAFVVIVAICRRSTSCKFEKSPKKETINGEYEAHDDDVVAKKSALSNKLQAMACSCDVGPVTTEVRFLIQKYPMHRE
jgi:hypothetical protein